MINAIIGLLIACYVVFVILRQIKNWKKGKYCNCSSRECAGSCQKNINHNENVNDKKNKIF